MIGNLRLSQRLISKAFWEAIFTESDAFYEKRIDLLQKINGLEKLRDEADYNTGSISFASAWTLYNLAHYFRIKNVIEIGTFIGKSTIAMGLGIDSHCSDGQIFTCDGSNDIKLPEITNTKINQFPKKTSGQMLNLLKGKFDLVFLDGRLTDEDLKLLINLVDTRTIFVVDDYEGVEKGVVNLIKLRELQVLNNHILVYPELENSLSKRGFTAPSLLSVLFPIARLQLVAQG